MRMIKKAAHQLLDGAVVPAPPVINYDFQDEFTTPESAPVSSPHTTEPGGETWVAVQIDGQLSISADQLSVPAQASPTFGDLGFYSSNSFARAAGLTCFIQIRISTGGVTILGFTDTQNANSTGYDNIGVALETTNFAARVTSNPTSPNILTLSTATDYIIALVLRNAGRYIYIRSGGAWLFCWADEIDSNTPLYAGIANSNSTFTSDYIRVTTISATLFDPVLEIPSPSVGSLTDLPAPDFFLQFTVTTRPSSGDILLHARRQDATNYWCIRIVGSSGTLQLREIVAGVDTLRASATSLVANGEVVTVVFRGTTVQGYATADEAWTYASATNFQSEVGFELGSLGTGGVINDIKVWYRTASVALAGALDAAGG